MISKNILLEHLTPYQGNKKVLVETQTTNNIIDGIISHHKKYASEYDKIYKYFVGASVEDTCRNIFDFIKHNIPYAIESDKMQQLKSPSSILIGKNDCKCYSLFTNGILDAYRRNTGKNFDLYYRFAGYNGGKNIEHVFSYLATGKKDFWIDAVLPTFDNRKQPTYILDKKIKPMALISVSGVPQTKRTSLPPYIFVGKRYESVGNCGCGKVSTRRRRIAGDEDEGDDWQKLFDALKGINWKDIFGGGAPSYGQRGDVDYGDVRNSVLSNMAYLQQNPDVAANWDDTPWAHWYVFGKNENRPQWVTIPGERFTIEALNKMIAVAKKNPELFDDIAKNKDKILKLLSNTGGSGGATQTKSSAILPIGIAISLLTLLK